MAQHDSSQTIEERGMVAGVALIAMALLTVAIVGSIIVRSL